MPSSRNPLVRLQKRFEEAFERFRGSYRGLLEICLHHRRVFLIAFFAICLGSLAILIPWLGRDFFPSVDSGTFKLHMRAPTGMRIEETANLCDLVEQSIRQQIPASEVQSVIDNIGLPYSGINLSYSNSAPVGHIGRRHSCDPVRQSSSHGRLHSPASPDTPETVPGRYRSLSCPPTWSRRF